MPASGIVNYEGAVSIFGQVEPHEYLPFQLFAAGTIQLEKLAIVHCLPSDQAVDLYVFEAVNNEDLLDIEPFDLFNDHSRAMRVSSGRKDTYEVVMNDNRIARFLLSHTTDSHSLSLS